MLKKQKSDDLLQHLHDQEMARFHQLVDKQVQRDGLDYLEAIIAVCEEYGIEVEECLPLLSERLMHALQQTCAQRKLLKGKQPADLEQELFT